jgi:hypothetical protein
MLGASVYPITIAEMEGYAEEADEWFDIEEHERVKEFLALHPESGDLVCGAGGVRILRWPIKAKRGKGRVRLIYYFRDLNMPLYLLALYRPGERIDLGEKWKTEISDLVEELVAEHSQKWAIIVNQQNGA